MCVSQPDIPEPKLPPPPPPPPQRTPTSAQTPQKVRRRSRAGRTQGTSRLRIPLNTGGSTTSGVNA